MKQLYFGLLIIIALIYAGCSDTDNSINNSSKIIFGVLPFENLSGNPNAGLIVMSDLESALSNGGKYKMIEPATVRSSLEPYQGQYLQPQKMAELIGAQIVITGTVTEYRYVYGAGEQPVVSVNVRVISAQTGKTILAKSYSSSGAFSWLKEASLGEISKKLCAKIAVEMKGKL